MPSTLHEFVARSAVRTAVLRAAADGGATIDDLLASVDGSRSAVYKSVDALADEGLVSRRDDGVVTTGRGDVLAGCLVDRDRLGRLVADDYWESHDASVLPARFRRRLPALAGAEVVASPPTFPCRARERARSLLADADSVDVLVAVRDPERASVLTARAAEAEPRVVVAEGLPDPGAAAPDADAAAVRTGPAPCDLFVTDSELALRLPTLDGGYDADAFLLARSDAALAWGRDLFDRQWRRGTKRRRQVA